MPKHVVEPSLFEFIDDYSSQLDAGDAIVDDVVPATSPAFVFAENAFAQFFENVVGVEIKGFDDRAKRKAARARASKKGALSDPALKLITLFQQFCNTYDDVRSASYGGQAEVLEEFHAKIVKRLIERIENLAKAEKDRELREAASSSGDYFAEVIKGYDWSQHKEGDDEDDDE